MIHQTQWSGNVFVIAEAGVNHNGSLELAFRLCDAARKCGADAVKFQTFRAQDLAVRGAPTANYQALQTGDEDQFAMLERLELSEPELVQIKLHCDRIGIEFFSTPFSIDAVDQLLRLGVRRLKLPSGELTHRALLAHAAATGLPLLVSTGMASLEEVKEALGWIIEVRGDLQGVVPMHCTSAYPAQDQALNLKAIATMRNDLGLDIGYSDHSLGIDAAVAAVALGAVTIEKHVTLDRAMNGPDHAASLEPAEFTRLVASIRRVSAMLGDGVKQPHMSERDAAAVARRSIVAAVDISAGQIISSDMVVSRRPASGIAPRDLDRVIGLSAREPLAAGTVLQWAMLTPPR